MSFPRIIFLDLEGTLLRKDIQLDNGRVAPSAWTVLAKKLGDECYRAEEQTKDKWLSGGYQGYLDWMRESVELHRKYGLTKSVYEELLASSEFVPGAENAIRYFKSKNSITAIVTGGFKGLADKAQKAFQIDHAFSGCEYFFNDESGLIEHFNLLPADEEGKVDFMKLVAREHGVSPADCAFVGDGKNDVHLARTVGFSVAFNAQMELREVADKVIDQPAGQEDWTAVIDVFETRFRHCDQRLGRRSNA